MNADDLTVATAISSAATRIYNELKTDVIARSPHHVCPHCMDIGLVAYALAQARATVELFPDETSTWTPQIIDAETKLEALITGTNKAGVVQ